MALSMPGFKSRLGHEHGFDLVCTGADRLMLVPCDPMLQPMTHACLQDDHMLMSGPTETHGHFLADTLMTQVTVTMLCCD